MERRLGIYDLEPVIYRRCKDTSGIVASGKQLHGRVLLRYSKEKESRPAPSPYTTGSQTAKDAALLWLQEHDRDLADTMTPNEVENIRRGLSEGWDPLAGTWKLGQKRSEMLEMQLHDPNFDEQAWQEIWDHITYKSSNDLSTLQKQVLESLTDLEKWVIHATSIGVRQRSIAKHAKVSQGAISHMLKATVTRIQYQLAIQSLDWDLPPWKSYRGKGRRSNPKLIVQTWIKHGQGRSAGVEIGLDQAVVSAILLSVRKWLATIGLKKHSDAIVTRRITKTLTKWVKAQVPDITPEEALEQDKLLIANKRGKHSSTHQETV